VDWVTNKIAIGNRIDAQNRMLLEKHGIRSVLTLDGSIGSSYVEEFALDDHATFNLIDGDGNNPSDLRGAIDTLIDMVAQSAPVLVHCRAGRSRSPVVVAGYLMRIQSLSVDVALARVAEKREIMLTPGIEKVLYTLYRY
jgi:protein-tyrosine phosphatase